MPRRSAIRLIESGRVRQLSAAIVLPLIVVLVNGSVAGAASPPGIPAPARSATDQMMLAQVPLDQAADRIRAISSGPTSGFAGTIVSGSKRTLTLYWNGAVPAAVATLLGELHHAGTNVVVRSAPYSQSQIEARAQQILADRESYRQHGITIDGVRLRPDATGVDVGADVSTPAAAGLSAGAAGSMLPSISAADVTAAVPAHIRPAFHSQPFDRLNDVKPHWAGARIVSTQNPRESCTSGFPIVRDSDGRTFITTANHCPGTNWWAANHWNSNPTADNAWKFGDTWARMPGLDVQYIRSVVGGFTYDHGVRPGTETAKPVAGASGNHVGDSVCESGSWTGIQCGLDIVNAILVPTPAGVVSEWEAVATSPNGVAGGRGDSGGPLFSLASNPAQVMARGSLVQGFPPFFTCPDNGNPGDFPNTCSSDIGFADENRILSNFGAHVLTG
jgi:hypothetical protein